MDSQRWLPAGLESRFGVQTPPRDGHLGGSRGPDARSTKDPGGEGAVACESFVISQVPNAQPAESCGKNGAGPISDHRRVENERNTAVIGGEVLRPICIGEVSTGNLRSASHDKPTTVGLGRRT